MLWKYFYNQTAVRASDTADPASSAVSNTTDPPPPQDNGAGDHGEPVPTTSGTPGMDA